MLFSPWLSTYRTSDGLDEELPQLTKKEAMPKIASRAKSPQIFFDIFSPSRFPFRGIRPPAITEMEALG